MEKEDIINVLSSDFLEMDEKFKILMKRGVNIDNSLISILLDSEINLDLQMLIIRQIKECDNFESQKFLKIDMPENEIKRSNLHKKNKDLKVQTKAKSRDDIDKELNESKATRPLSEEEFNKIISILQFGVKYKDKRGSNRRIEANKQVALILCVQATIGFRINDILRMRLRDIRGTKISFIEQKTKKLQYRKVNIDFIESLQNYAIDNELALDDYLFNTTARNIQMRLKKVTEYLGYNYIGTHSFRKFYAVNAYKASNNNLEMVRNLLNHSSVSITQRYINVDQDKIDEYSSSVNFVKASLVN